MEAAHQSSPRPVRFFGADTIDLQDVLIILREKSWIIGVCVLVAVTLGLAYIARTPSTYRATSVLRVDPERANIVNFTDVASQDLADVELLQTIVLSFWSRPVLERVVKSNDLQTLPAFMPLPANGNPIPLETAIGFLRSLISVEIRRGTRLLDVSVEHGNPHMAQKLADAVAMAFIEETIHQRALTSQTAHDFLLEEAARLKQKLRESELRMQAYKEENPNAASLEERQDTVVGKLTSLSEQLADAKARRLRLETDWQEAERLQNDADALLQIPSVATHPQILDLQKQVTSLEQRIVTLKSRYTEKHPKMIEARASLEGVKESIPETALQLPQLLRAAFDTAVSNEESFQRALADQEKLALALTRQGIDYNVLKRDVETDQAVYESILQRLKETDIAKGIESNNIRLFEKAGFPGAPVKPQKTRVLALSLLIGLVGGVGLSLGLHVMDNSVRTVDQAEEATGLPVLGAICRQSGANLSRDGLPVIKEPASTVAEGFRSLRASLALATGSARGHVTLLTSAVPSEGKTFVCLNYAAVLAQQGLRVLLIEADLRRPTVASILCNNRADPGVYGYLQGDVRLDRAVRPSGIANLDVITAGKISLNPAELLSGPRFGQLLKEAAPKYDRIVVDTAPVLALSDTLLLVKSVDSICLVVRSGNTTLRLINRAVQVLRRAEVKITGLILNRLPPNPGASSYIYYYSADKYGSDDVYVESEIPKIPDTKTPDSKTRAPKVGV